MRQIHRLHELAKAGVTAFIQEIRNYDGSKEAFSVIIGHALNRHNITAREVAKLAMTNETSVCRWTHGAAMANEMRRKAVVTKIANLLEKRLEPKRRPG